MAPIRAPCRIENTQLTTCDQNSSVHPDILRANSPGSAAINRPTSRISTTVTYVKPAAYATTPTSTELRPRANNSGGNARISSTMAIHGPYFTIHSFRVVWELERRFVNQVEIQQPDPLLGRLRGFG